jgi:hypothetical protein
MMLDIRWFSLVGLAALLSGPVSAQQQTAPAGSPDATITIDGKQLPAPPQSFGGQINQLAQDSKPYWPGAFSGSRNRVSLVRPV